MFSLDAYYYTLCLGLLQTENSVCLAKWIHSPSMARGVICLTRNASRRLDVTISQRENYIKSNIKFHLFNASSTDLYVFQSMNYVCAPRTMETIIKLLD
jgi:hypothetical protein